MALLVPAVAIGALTLPHTFKAGSPVSAAAMNENFAKLAEAVDGLTASIGTVDAKQPGIPKSANFQVVYAQPKLILKAAATGILYARPVGSGNSYLGVSLTVGDGLTSADPPVLTCGGSPCNGFASRTFEADSTDALVPAGAYVQVDGIYASEVAATVNFMWQPMDTTKGTLPSQIYPVQ